MHISKLVLVMVVALMLALVVPFAGLTTQAQAAGLSPVVKDNGSTCWDYTYPEVRYIGCYSWRVLEVMTNNEVITYMYASEGNSEVRRTITDEVLSEYNWSSKQHVRYDTVTGIAQINHYGGRGEETNGYSYRSLWTFVNGELKVDHYWVNGLKIF